MANISANANNEELFHAYYANPTAIAPVYTSLINFELYGGQANHRINARDYTVEFEATNKLPVTFISKVGTYQQDILRGWTNVGCNGAGIITDTSSSWRDECDKAGTYTILENGILRKRVNILKEFGGGLTTLNRINKTYTFYPTHWTINVTIVGRTGGNEVSFTRINHNAGGGNPFNLFNFETSTGNDPDFIDCAGGHELVGGWSSGWASVCRIKSSSEY